MAAATRTAPTRPGPRITVLLYAVFASLWIASSDWLLSLMIDDPELLLRLSAAKGFLFVAVTSGLLFMLLKGWRSPERDEAEGTRPWEHRNRLAAILVLLTAMVPLIGFGIIQLQGPRIEAVAYADIRAIAQLKTAQIENWLQERRASAQVLASSNDFVSTVGDWVEHSSGAARRKVIARLKHLEEIYGYQIDLYDSKNHPLRLAAEPGEPPGQSLAAALSAAVRERKALFRDYDLGTGGQIGLDYIAPLLLRAPGGPPRATAVIVLHIPAAQFLYPLVQNWPISNSSAQITLLRKDPKEPMFLDELRRPIAAAFSVYTPRGASRTAAGTAITGSQQTLAGTDYRGIPVLAAVRPVQGTSWLVLAQVDRDQVMAPLKVLVLWVSIVAFFAVLCGVAAVLLLWRQQMRQHQLELLAQAADKDRLLRHFYDLPLIGMAITSPTTRKIQHANDQMCRIVNYTRQELLGLTWPDLIHPDNLAADLLQYQRMLDGHTDGYERDTRLIRKDGAVIDVTINMQCVRNAKGEIELKLATVQDVTERRAMEQARRESEANLKLAQRVAQIGSWSFELASGTFTCSEECCRIFNLPPGSALTYAAFTSLIHPDDCGLWEAQWRDTAGGAPSDLEHRIIVDGRIKWLRHRTELRCDASGGLIGRIGTLQDITERKNIEIRLQENEAVLRQSQSIANIGHYVLDVQSGLWTSSEVLNRIFGIADQPYHKNHQTWADRVHPEQREAVLSYFQDHVLRDLNPFDLEYRIVRADDGAVRWLHGLGRLEIGKDGKPLRMLGTIQDITERKQAEMVLIESKERYRSLEERFRIIYEGALDGILLIDPDTSRFIMANPAFSRMLGYPPEEISGLGIADIVLESDLGNALERFQAHLAGAEPLTADMPLKRKDGALIHVDAHSSPVRLSGKSYQLAILRDVTERRKNEERLRLAATVFDNSREGVMVVDVNDKILMVNRAFCELKGYSESELLGCSPSLLRSGRHDSEFYAAMWDSINRLGHWQGEIWNRRKDGEVFPELASISVVTDRAGNITHYVGVYTDITHLKASEEKLEFIAHHDPLTQLPNRLLIHSRLNHSLEIARREGRRLALLMLDLDRFKDVNDSFGHLAGDELLQQVSRRLTGRLRGIDTVARLGGDEFALLLDNPSHPEDAARVADEIIGILGEPWRLANGAEIRIGTSVGISLFPEHGRSAEALLQQADAALYRAKAEGRGCCRYFSDDMTRAARRRVELETELRHALHNGELQVYFQPQVDIASGAISGAEALLRWHHPEKGMISPAQFIPIAEETGLIGLIGAWVMRETCRQGREWLDAGLPALTLSVNISAQQFLYGDIGALVAQVLADTGFPAEQLELELTESVLMEREGEAEGILRRLRAQLVRLAIDDFGTGYSSLAYLKRFPINVLKIDKRFIDDIPHEQDDMAIAAAIIAMAHTLGFEVLAEGVETIHQLAFLKSQGCDRYQGFLTSPALGAAEFAALLTAGGRTKQPRRA